MSHLNKILTENLSSVTIERKTFIDSMGGKPSNGLNEAEK